MSRVVGVILARLDSSRLPRKMLQDIEGRPLLDYVIARARRIQTLTGIVLATSDRPVDDDLEAFARDRGVDVYRGASDDVAGRVLQCARALRADAFVRLNGDSPFLDPGLIGVGIALFKPGVGLVTNLPGRTYPYGLSVEVVAVDALQSVYESMTPEEREHVTEALYAQPHVEVRELRSDSRFPPVRLVVDTPEDLVRFAAAVRHLGSRVDEASLAEVLAAYGEEE